MRRTRRDGFCMLALCYHALNRKQESVASTARLEERYGGKPAYMIAEIYTVRAWEH